MMLVRLLQFVCSTPPEGLYSTTYGHSDGWCSVVASCLFAVCDQCDISYHVSVQLQQRDHRPRICIPFFSESSLSS